MEKPIYTERQYEDFQRQAENYIDEYFQRLLEFVQAMRTHSETGINQFLRMLDREDPPDITEEILWQVILLGVTSVPGAVVLKGTQAMAKLESAGRVTKVRGFLKYFANPVKDRTAFYADRANNAVSSMLGVGRTAMTQPGKGSKGKFQSVLSKLRGDLNQMEPNIQHERKWWGNFVSLPQFCRHDFMWVKGKKVRISPLNLFAKRCLQISPDQPYLHVQKKQLDELPHKLEATLWALHVGASVKISVTRWPDETDAVGEWKIIEGLNETQFAYIRQQFTEIRQVSDLVTKWKAEKVVMLKQHPSGHKQRGEW